MTHNHTKRLCLWCLAQTMGFPIEHFMWERLPVLSAISRGLGL